jgi:CBS-domain-containing membrane protein
LEAGYNGYTPCPASRAAPKMGLVMSENPGATPQLVRDLMTVGVLTCSPATRVIDLARLLLDKETEAIVVLDPADGHALGYISQAELVRAYAQAGWPAGELTAEQVMQDDVPQSPPDIPLTAAAQLMLDRGVRVLFLMHHSAGIEYPAALITYQHLLRHLGARTNDELTDLGFSAARQSPLEAFIQRREAARRQNLAGD